MIDNVTQVNNKLDASIHPEAVQTIDESSQINSSNDAIKASFSIINSSLNQIDLIRNLSSSSDPTHYKSTKRMNFLRSQTIDIC